MGSSQLKIENRTSLYFGKYMYRAQCQVMGASYTYYTNNITQFKNKLENTKASRNNYRISVYNNRFEETIDHIDFEQIEKFFEWKKNKDTDQYMFRIQGNQVSFFSNDLSLLKTLTEIDENPKYSKAEIQSTDTLYFKKEPKYKYRTYFKGKKAPIGMAEHIEDLIKMYGDKIKFSPGMIRNLNRYPNSPYRYMHTSYYVDYNDQSMLSIFGLWFGENLGKSFSLKKE